MTSPAYPTPVDQLLVLGEETASTRSWKDYSLLGISAADIPALIRMATDPNLNHAPSAPDHWAPLHAWRALAQLRAVEAVEPLIALKADLIDDHYLSTDFPIVCGMIGVSAIPALGRALERVELEVFARASIAEGLARIGMQHPEVRDQCARLVAQQLERFAGQDPTLNGLLVSALLDLEAVDHAETIESAMAADAVDLTVAGDWEDVQVELGLLAARVTPAPPTFWKKLTQDAAAAEGSPTGSSFDLETSDRPWASPPHASRSARAKARARQKAKRKQAKASKRRNRGR